MRTPRTNPAAPRVPSDSTITRPRPTPSDAGPIVPDRRPRQSGSNDTMWRDRQPANTNPRADAPATLRPSPSPSVRARTPEPSDATRATIRPRPADSRTGRYAPPATVRDGTTNVTARPRAEAGGTTTARLVPRSTSPRLTVPRSSSFATGSLIGGSVVATGAPRSTVYAHDYSRRDDCHRTFWRTWWDPCRYDSWSRWNVYGGYGAFGWSVSLWQPWWYYRTHYWHDCYFDSWWWSSSRPAAVSTGYWWYPSTVYCPTYLYVPSTSVVYVDRDPISVAATGPADETIVAGSNVGGSAQVIERSPIGNEDLAKRYVELGDFYFEVGRYAEAADAYARAKEYAPANASVHLAMADAAFAAGDYHYAAFLIGEAIRLQPSLVSATIDRRSYYADAKAFDEQMAGLERYLAEKPYDAQAHLVRGYNLRFSGQPTAAIAAFRRVLEIAPENRAAAVFLDALAPANSEAVLR